MKKFLVAAPILALALGGTTACATKKFVRGEVTQVNDKVETLNRSLEETQERTRTNEGRIGEVDQKAAAAGTAATAAQQRADEARSAAAAVNTRADAIERASKRIVYEVVLSEDKANFKFGQAVMPDESKAEIDQLVQQLKAEPNGAFIEIEGHTDSAGPATVNYQLGLERDRKSTRLNSSHLVISYAVFCLKKKRNNNFDTKMMQDINMIKRLWPIRLKHSFRRQIKT